MSFILSKINNLIEKIEGFESNGKSAPMAFEEFYRTIYTTEQTVDDLKSLFPKIYDIGIKFLMEQRCAVITEDVPPKIKLSDKGRKVYEIGLNFAETQIRQESEVGYNV